MLTIETLQKDMMAAVKARDTIRKSALSNAVSEVKKAAIDKNCRDNISEELIISVLRKEIKVLNEQIETCPLGKSALRTEFEAKKAVLNEYVPELITDKTTVQSMIYQLIDGIELKKSNKGLVMKTVMPSFKGKVDMKIAQEVVNTLLT